MNLTLTRTDFLASGIFGKIKDDNGFIDLYTLEHSFEFAQSPQSSSMSYLPIIKPGQYTCVRGPHLLKGHDKFIETFEVLGVAGHTGVLFHPGNWNKDSEGCILLGLVRDGNLGILNSQEAFNRFMALQYDINRFILTVV